MKQKSHKLLSLLLTCALMLSLAPTALAACNHQWSEWKTDKEATCSEEGQISHVCSICKKKETKSVTKKAHTWGTQTVITPATCTTSGKATRTCTVCKTTDENVNIPALSHNYVEVNSAIDEEGYEWKKITATCGEVLPLSAYSSHNDSEDGQTHAYCQHYQE